MHERLHSGRCCQCHIACLMLVQCTFSPDVSQPQTNSLQFPTVPVKELFEECKLKEQPPLYMPISVGAKLWIRRLVVSFKAVWVMINPNAILQVWNTLPLLTWKMTVKLFFKYICGVFSFVFFYPRLDADRTAESWREEKEEWEVGVTHNALKPTRWTTILNTTNTYTRSDTLIQGDVILSCSGSRSIPRLTFKMNIFLNNNDNSKGNKCLTLTEAEKNHHNNSYMSWSTPMNKVMIHPEERPWKRNASVITQTLDWVFFITAESPGDMEPAAYSGVTLWAVHSKLSNHAQMMQLVQHNLMLTCASSKESTSLSSHCFN